MDKHKFSFDGIRHFNPQVAGQRDHEDIFLNFGTPLSRQLPSSVIPEIQQPVT